MFLVTQFPSVSIPIFSGFLCLEQLGDALCEAAAMGDVEKVKKLLALGYTPDARGGQNNKTPLHCAVENNSTEAAKLLLERGAEIEARNTKNQTPLHFASLNNSTEAAKLLLERGAEIEARDVESRTPLHLAALNKSTEAAKLLLERGAEIEAKDVDNRTPLEVSREVSENTEAIIRLLTEHAANFS